MSQIDDLMTRAQTLIADCNQTESAREVIAELVERVKEVEDFQTLHHERHQRREP